MANETPQSIVDKAQAAAKLAQEAATSAQSYADQIAAQAVYGVNDQQIAIP